MAWLDPRTSPRLTDKVCQDVNDVVVAEDGKVACFVDEAVPGVGGEVETTVAVVGERGADGEVEAEEHGRRVGLVVHGGSWKGVGEPGAGQGGTAGEDAGPVEGGSGDEGGLVGGCLCSPGECTLELDGQGGGVAVKSEHLGGSGRGRWEVYGGNVGGELGGNEGEGVGNRC